MKILPSKEAPKQSACKQHSQFGTIFFSIPARGMT
jgi:hypothetical protein